MSTDGVVKLKGTVNSAQKKAKAEEIACKVDGAPCAFTLFDTHAKLLQFSKKLTAPESIQSIGSSRN